MHPASGVKWIVVIDRKNWWLKWDPIPKCLCGKSLASFYKQRKLILSHSQVIKQRWLRQPTPPRMRHLTTRDWDFSSLHSSYSNNNTNWQSVIYWLLFLCRRNLRTVPISATSNFEVSGFILTRKRPEQELGRNADIRGRPKGLENIFLWTISPNVYERGQ